MNVRQISAFLSVAATLLATAAVRGEWTQFRGPNASGLADSSASLPTKFSASENVRWSIPLGDGIASPIVAGGRVFVTEMTAADQFAVVALDRTTGEVLWRRPYETGALPPITAPNSHASSTPATDGERVYAYFSTLGLVALDAASGEEVWRVELPRPAYLMDWGAAASPIVRDGRVYFNQDDDLSPYLLALDAKTGEQRWRTPREEMLAGYAVPLFIESNGQAELVVAGTGKLKGYDPATGQELWTCNSLLRTIMSTPVARGDMIYLSCQSYGDTERVVKFALLQWKDTNQDGKLTKAEIPAEFAERFDKADADRDGFLVDAEIDAAFQSPKNMVGGGSVVEAIQGGGRGDVTKTHIAWRLDNKAPSNISSPLLVGDKLFMVKKGGLASCFQAGSGKALWETKRIRNLGDYYASPVAGDGKIYVTGENGFVVVLEDADELKILSKNDMGDSCLATPAISDGDLFIRARGKLICVTESK